MSDQQFSHEEIERMRAILAQHDQTNKTGIQEFDLNNPPKVPYTHQEFPKVVYHHAKQQMRKAQNPEDLEAAIAAGWSREPFPAEGAVEEPELDETSAAEAAAADAKLRSKKKG